MHHHLALLHRHALILERLLMFLVAFSTLVFKLFFSQSLSIHSQLAIYPLLRLIWNLTTRGVWQSLAVV